MKPSLAAFFLSSPLSFSLLGSSLFFTSWAQAQLSEEIPTAPAEEPLSPEETESEATETPPAAEPTASSTELETESDGAAPPEEPASASLQPSAPPEQAQGRPSPLQVQLGSRLYSRSFRYTDSLAQLYPSLGYEPLASYHLSAAPMPFLEGEWYPGAHFRSGLVSHFGLTFGYERGLFAKLAHQGRELDQSHYLWHLGFRFRIPLSQGEVGLITRYSQHGLTVHDQGSPAAFPGIRYQTVELGADTEWRFDQAILGAHLHYLIQLDTGELGSAAWFPHTDVRGIDWGAYVGWQFSPMFDVLLGLNARSYGHDFNPIATETDPSRVAGGATDRTVSAWLGLRIRWPEDAPARSAAGADGSETPASSQDDFDSFDSFD